MTLARLGLPEEDGSLKRTSSITYDDHGNVSDETRTDGTAGQSPLAHLTTRTIACH